MAKLLQRPSPELRGVSDALEIPLLPLQARILEKYSPHDASLSQVLTFRVAPELDATACARALEGIARRHSVFRLRLRETREGWKVQGAQDPLVAFQVLDLGARPQDQQVRALQSAIAATAVDLCSGPLLSALYARRGGESDVLVVVVSCVWMDSISCGLLQSDLESRLGNTPPASSPATGMPIDEWACRLLEASRSGYFSAQRGYWRAQLDPLGAKLPPSATPRVTAETLHTELQLVSIPGWSRLQQALDTTLPATSGEILVSLLYLGLRDWMEQDRIGIMLERAGRTSSLAPGGLARTIGALSCSSPLLLQGAGNTLAQILHSLLGQLRGLPDEGLGYEILRYLGEETAFGGLPEPAIAFRFVDIPADPGVELPREALRPISALAAERGLPAALRLRPPLFDVDCTAWIQGDAAQLAIRHSTPRVPRGSVERLARAIRGNAVELQELFVRSAGRNPGPTPPDLSSPREEERATRTLGAIGVQQGILLHAGLESPHGVYINQTCIRLRGRICESRLREAWTIVLARHDGLRVSFSSDSTGALTQVIHQHAELPWRSFDLQEISAGSREASLETLARLERDKIFRTDVVPLMRVACVRLDAATVELIWTYHHVLLDGWSHATVLVELMRAYTFGQGGFGTPAPSLLAYDAWLRNQNLEQARRYWQALLADYRAPAVLPGSCGDGTGVATTTELLSAELTESLSELGRQMRSTLAVILQAAWAITLHAYYDTEDIVFGTSVSGRPPELPGAEELVGLFIRTVPVRSTVHAAMPIEELISRLFRQQAESSAAAVLPVGQILDVHPSRASYGLFETLMVVENFYAPVVGERTDDIEVVSIEMSERPHYAFTLAAIPAAQLRLRLSYRAERFTAELAHTVLGQLASVLEQMVRAPFAPLSSITVLNPWATMRGNRDSQVTSSSHAQPRAGDIASADEFETALTTIWEEVLQQAPIASIDEDFYDLGGHSLRLAQVISRVRATFHVEIEFAELYGRTTIREQADYIRGRAAHGEPPIPPLELARRAAGVPLTPPQAGMWYLCQDARLNQAYNIPLVLEVAGPFVVEHGLRALSSLLARHESLRTVLEEKEGQIRQRVLEAPPPQIDFLSASTETHAQELADQVSRHIFDWRKEPLFRARLIEISGGRHWLALNIHHLICDAWSVGILLSGFSRAYLAAASGAADPEAAPALQFGDYAAWITSSAQGQRLSRSIDYWLGQLSGYRGVLEISTDYPRPAEQRFRGGAVAIRWESDLSDLIRARCEASGITPFMLLLSAYALLLGRLANCDDLVVGVLHARRDRLETESLVGLLAGMLPMRIRVADAQSTARYLDTVRALTLAAFDNSDAPLERIIDALGLPRRHDRMPLVQAAFTLQNTDLAASLPSGLEARPRPIERRSAKFDLALTLREAAEGYRGEIEFDAELFAPDTIASLAQYLEAIVRQLCTAGVASVGEIELESEDCAVAAERDCAE